MTPDWLTVRQGTAPLIVSVPHAGARIPPEIETRLQSPWLAREDADWHVRELYDFAPAMGASLVATDLSRTVIDLNRDPSGASLYPGQATTGLCPTESFDGVPLYLEAAEPDDAEIGVRTHRWFAPYHEALAAEIARLKARFGRVVLLDAHSIRSRVPRLFEGALPEINLGTNSGRSCDADLVRAVEAACDGSGFTRVTDGRFKGGWITRHYGRPDEGVHAFQIELAMRAYLDEPDEPGPENWPPPYDPARAARLRAVLSAVAGAALDFCTDPILSQKAASP